MSTPNQRITALRARASILPRISEPITLALAAVLVTGSLRRADETVSATRVELPVRAALVRIECLSIRFNDTDVLLMRMPNPRGFSLYILNCYY